MNKLNYYLRDPKAIRATPIIGIFFTGRRQRIKISTGMSVLPQYWNHTKQRFRTTYLNHVKLNKQLNDFEEKVIQAYTDCVATYGSDNITPEMIMDILFPPAEEKIITKFIPLYEKFMEARKPLISGSQYRSYRSTLMHFRQYEIHKNRHYDVSMLTDRFYDDYISWCLDKLHLNPNYVSKDIKHFKTFAKWLIANEVIVSSPVLNFKLLSVPSDKVALSQDDLDRLIKADFSLNDRLNNVRNMFLLQVYTGMRICDFKRLSGANRQGSNIEYFQQKIHAPKIIIPMTSQMKAILDIYPEGLPFISDQKFNDYIKEVCKFAGIDDMIVIQRYEGREKIIEEVPKYSIITTHTGRRTFATLSLEKGMRPEVVMKFTGHSSLASFWKYVKISPSQYVTEMLRAWEDK